MIRSLHVRDGVVVQHARRWIVLGGWMCGVGGVARVATVIRPLGPGVVWLPWLLVEWLDWLLVAGRPA